MHALDMSRALPELMSPDLDAWFADPVVQGYQRSMNPELPLSSSDRSGE
jgi:hypothetical protein